MTIYTSLCSRVLFPIHERLKHHDSVKMRRELERSQWTSGEELRALQTTRLRAFLADIGRNVPYYRDAFAAHQFEPESLDSIGDLASLPFLTKSVVRDNFERMTATDSGPIVRYSTGGSSGEPLVFNMGMGRVTHDVAAKWRATRWWGVDIGDREIVLWGSPIEIGKQDRVKSLRDRILRTRLLPAFQMSEAAMDAYLKSIRDYRPRMLFGYASALALLAEHARGRSQSMDDLDIRVAFVTGETLYPQQRDAIEAVFGAPVANGYGARDAGFIAHACPSGSLHLSAEHVIVEILDNAGHPVPDGEIGEIVVTHLATRDFPFLRYRSGDMAVMSPKACACGRGLPSLEKVLGRSTDFIRTRSGNAMHALALIYEVRDERGVRGFKFIQSEDLSIALQLVVGPDFTSSQERAVVERLVRRLGAETPLTVQRVLEIPPERSGKHRYVVSHAR